MFSLEFVLIGNQHGKQVYLSIYLFIYLFIHLSVCRSIDIIIMLNLDFVFVCGQPSRYVTISQFVKFFMKNNS